MEEKIKKIRQIMISVNRIDGIYYRWAKNAGIKENTLALFYVLSDGQPHSQKEICDEWFIPKTTINTIVKEYIQKEFIVFDKASNGKEKKLLITKKGKKFVEKTLDELFAHELEAFEATEEKYGDNAMSEILANFTDELAQRLLPDLKEK